MDASSSCDQKPAAVDLMQLPSMVILIESEDRVCEDF